MISFQKTPRNKIAVLEGERRVKIGGTYILYSWEMEVPRSYHVTSQVENNWTANGCRLVWEHSP
jgi:hypothetical protein